MSSKLEDTSMSNFNNIQKNNSGALTSHYSKIDSISKMDTYLKKLYLPSIPKKTIPKMGGTTFNKKLIKSQSYSNFSSNEKTFYNQNKEKEKLMLAKISLIRIKTQINELMANYKKLLAEKEKNMCLIREAININDPEYYNQLTLKIEQTVEETMKNNKKNFTSNNNNDSIKYIDDKNSKNEDIKGNNNINKNNFKNINEHSEQKLEEVNNNSKIAKSKSSKVKKSSKTNKLKVSQKEAQKSNFDDLINGNRFHNKNILDYIKQKEEKETTECSFKPKINKKIGFEINKSSNNKEENIPNLPQNKNVVERLLLWNQRVKQKLIEKKNERDKQNIEKDVCTFTPTLKSEVPKFEKKKINGSDKYYDRIKNSREIKKEKEKKLNPDYDELYKKYYKNKENTYLQKNKKVIFELFPHLSNCHYCQPFLCWKII